MRSVFVGPEGDGKSTLINRILGVNILPTSGKSGAVTRNMITIHNTHQDVYSMTILLTPMGRVDITAHGERAHQTLFRACVNQNLLVKGRDDNIPLEQIPWQRLYATTAEAAARMSRVPYRNTDRMQEDLVQIMQDGANAMFIEEIVIEGHFPNLNRDDMIVDMPYRGYTERTDAQLHDEVTTATLVFCVLELGRRTYHVKTNEASKICALLPPSKPLHVCFTHGLDVLRKMAESSDDGGKRMRREIHPIDLVEKEQYNKKPVRGHEVTTRLFDSGDETGLDEHMLEELIEFIKRGGRM